MKYLLTVSLFACLAISKHVTEAKDSTVNNVQTNDIVKENLLKTSTVILPTLNTKEGMYLDCRSSSMYFSREMFNFR